MNLHRVILGGLLVFGAFLCQIHVQTAMGQVRPRVAEAVDDERRVSLNENVHPLARAEFDRGVVADSQPINRILLLLKRSDEQEAALQATLAKLQDKSSPSFHQWLTPEQFGAQFGPADADVQAVTDWLTRQGFSAGKVYSGKTVIEFSGTARQVQRAFGTAIHSYQVNGKTYSANASDPQIPAALAPVVTGVVSLHNFPRDFYARRFGTLRRNAGKSVVEPLVTLPNPFGPGNFYGLGPGDFAKIYGVPAKCGNPAVACTGSGQTIAIVGETNLLVSDVQRFRSIFGLPATFDANSIVYNGEDPGITSTDEEGEADLDTQWSGAVAPGATIKYVLSASTPASQGVDLSALYIVEHNLAAVMSESYGACESSLGSTENSFVNNLWQQASAQGITVAVSTGDSGSAGCDDPNQESLATHSPAVSGLASTPYNVAVGGTDFDEYNNWATYWNITNDPVTGTSVKGYIPEIPWNQNCAQLGAAGCNINTTPVQLQNIVAGGGGPSAKYSKPSWQTGVAGMPNDGKRDLPDVSLLASPGFNGTGFLYCQVDALSQCAVADGFTGNLTTFGVIGGTSASAPSFAGVMALINQSQATAQNPAPRQGNANYVLYALAHKAGASCVSATPVVAGCSFNDVTKGSSALPTGGTGLGTISVPCRGGVVGCSATLTSQIGVLDDPKKPGSLAWNAGTGYDLATGLGSLNVGNLVTNWGSVASVQTTTTLSLTPTTGITHGSESVAATISVTPNSGTATGVVSLIAKLPDGTAVGAGEFTLGTNGSVTGTATNLPGGSNYPVYAHYSGDGVNAPSDSAVEMVSVTPENSKTFIVIPTFDPTTGSQVNGNATSVTYGTPYFIRMYVTNSGGVASATGAPTGACKQSSNVACASGTVSLTANGQGVDGLNGIFQLNDIGYTRDISPTLPGGSYSLVALYSGDGSYTGSTSATHALTVTPATTRILPSNPPLPSQMSTPFNLGVVLTTDVSGVMPSCNFTFYDGTTALPGTVTCTWQANGPFLYTSLPITQATSGTHTYTAKFAGDQNYAPSASSPMTTRVSQGTATTLTADSLTVQYGANINLTAVVDSTLSQGPPIGQTVSFFFDNILVTGTVTYTPFTDSSGNIALRAKITAQPQSSGFYTANFPGDSTYGQSGALINVTVNIPEFSVGANLPSSSIIAGNTGAGTVTVTPASDASSPVTLACPGSGMPMGISCSFSPGTVNLSNSNPASSALTISTLAPSPSTSTAFIPLQPPLYFPPHLYWPLSAASLFTLLFLYFVPVRLRRRRLALRATVASAMSLFVGFAGCGGGSTGGGGGGGGGGPAPSSVTLTTSSVKVSWNNNSGGTVNLAANVSSSNSPGGTVTFFVDGNNGFSVSSPVVSGVAQFQLTGLSVGIHTITAQYSGDANTFGSQTKGSLRIAVTGQTGFSVVANTGNLFHTIGVNFSLQ